MDNFNTNLSLLTEIGKEIISSLDTKTILVSTYKNLHYIVDAPILVIGIFNRITQGMDLYGIKDSSDIIISGHEPMVDQKRWAVRCFLDQTEFCINNTQLNFELNVSNILFSGLNEIRKSLIYIPLTFREKKIGFVCVQSFKQNAYQDFHVEQLRNLAAFITIALDNSDAYRMIDIQKREIIRKSEKIEQAKENLEEQVKQRTEQINQQNQTLENQSNKLKAIVKEMGKLTEVVKQTHNAVIIMDAEGNIEWVNESFERIFEYNLDEFIEIRGRNLRKNSFSKEIDQRLQVCINQKKTIIYESISISKSGKTIWTLTTVSPILDEDGNICNLVAIDSDISKQKAFEEKILLQKAQIEEQAIALEQTNQELEKLSIVARQTENAIMIMDAQGNIKWINDYFTKIYEYTLEEFISKRGKNIIETSFNPEIRVTIESCISEKKAVFYEALNITQEGKNVWTQTTLTPILNTDGDVIYLVTIDSDITQRKASEDENMRQKQQIEIQAKYLEKINSELEMLSIVAKETENAIMIMDATGNIKWINDCFTKIYNYTFDEFIAIRGKNILQTSFNPKIKITIEKCIAEKKPVFYEALNITHTGDKVWTHTTLTPILNENGEIINLVTIDSDISKTKAAEELITKQKKNITDSIQYASTIQSAILPTEDMMDELFTANFVIYKPKNIVSGDFYWLQTIGNKILLAAVDCTGHGVPGAFMSMLGIAFLNEIASKNKIEIQNDSFSAAKILAKMRNLVKKSLKQTDIKSSSRDGMDVALCIIDMDRLQLNFAGAFSPILIYSDHKLIEYKGDRMPVGIHYREKENFTDHHHQLKIGDRFYLFSDGFYSQFGGIRNTTFKTRQFKNLITDIQNSPFQAQQSLIENKFEEWRGKTEQVDDVLIIGIEV